MEGDLLEEDGAASGLIDTPLRHSSVAGLWVSGAIGPLVIPTDGVHYTVIGSGYGNA